MTDVLGLLRLLAKGNAKALYGAVGTFVAALAVASVEGGISQAELLFALAALFGVGVGVRQIPNRGSKANATEVPLIGSPPSIDAIHTALAQALGSDVHFEFDANGYGRIVLGPAEEVEPE